MYNYIRGQQGFLLVDIMLAVVIISVALLAIAGSYIQFTKMTVSATQYTVATNLAQMQMESLKKLKASDWADKSLPTTIAWQDTTSIDPTKLSPPVTVTTTVKECSEDRANLVEVTVVVSGINQKANYNETFTTFFPKNPL